MKKQVVVIHGGRTFRTYEEYIHSLKTRELTLERCKGQPIWHYCLQEDLGEDWEVFTPKMPNGNNAVYEEWKIWFERVAEFLSRPRKIAGRGSSIHEESGHDDVVLIGHSLGGIFLAKYLAENDFSKKIKVLALLAAPFDEESLGESLGGFALSGSLDNISQQAEKIYLIFSQDDPIVPFANAQKYQQTLKGAELIAFEHKQHFNQDCFPELVELIKKIVV